jgi:hypothetical protein
LRKPITWVAVVILAAAGAFGLYWFQPWKLFTDETVDEALSSPRPEPDGGPARSPAPSAGPSDEEPEPDPEPAAPVLVTEGEFISHEHETTGTARIVRRPDGGYQLELVDLATSNGPDLRVWLTDQPVIEGRDGWHVFDDGEWVELDRLKGNLGNQVYDIPDDVDLDTFTSVSIWCKRFSVSFGAAALGT